MIELTGKTAVITGGASGIGLGLARACLAEGMNVAISDIDEARLDATVSNLRAAGGNVVGHVCNVGDAQQVTALRDATLASLGPIALVCNNAGLGLTRPVVETTDRDWELLLGVNLEGVVNGIRTFLPLFVEQGMGHLNATSSLSGLVADPDLVIYNGTKFAVVGMMEGLALEMRRDHPSISCSVLCPGPVATDLIATSSGQLHEGEEPDLDTENRNAAVAAYLAAGMHPDDVGRFAIDGIKSGKFWLITHPDYTFDILRPRFEAMQKGMLHVGDDWATVK